MMMMMIRAAFGKISPILILILSVIISDSNASANGGVFHVQHKFAGQQPSVRSLIDHDTHRHQRFLHSVNLPLNGTNDPTGYGLYFTKIKLGTPSKDYYVNIDTGTGLTWVGCASCNTCPKMSGIGVELTLYNTSNSSTSRNVSCNEDYCPEKNCLRGSSCTYDIMYDLDRIVSGYYVKDIIEYERVSGNLTTTPATSTVVFGCTMERSRLPSTIALDGVIGFDQSPYSIISQISAAGETKRKFSHCIRHSKGGGIFAIGDVTWPVVKTTPMVPKRDNYIVNLISIMVGEGTLDFPESVLSTKNMTETVVDSGISLAYLPEAMYQALLIKIFKNHGDLVLESHGDIAGRKRGDNYICFGYKGRLEDFPNVTLIFDGSLQLVVTPQIYLYELKKGDTYCLLWQISNQETLDGRGQASLGATVLSNQLVVYDLENQVIGWSNYDCSENILVKDEESKQIFGVDGRKSSIAQSHREIGRSIILFFLSAIFTTIY
ncbi:hypothetical protein ACHQM5_027859 [Ranunculus cassubicifolius]